MHLRSAALSSEKHLDSVIYFFPPAVAMVTQKHPSFIEYEFLLRTSMALTLG